MPLFNYLKVWASAIAEILEPGERPIAVGPYREPLNPDSRWLELVDDELSPFERQFKRDHGRRPEEPARTVELGQINTHIWQKLISGSAGRGSPRSYAGMMWRAGKASESAGYAHWLVTDRRLLLVTFPGSGSTGLPRVEFAVPRSRVRSVCRRFKILFGWGQVEVNFSDDSTLAILAGILDVGFANQFIRSLNSAAIDNVGDV